MAGLVAKKQLLCSYVHTKLITVCSESTIRKKMATGTFTYNALRAKTLKERIKTQGKIVSH